MHYKEERSSSLPSLRILMGKLRKRFSLYRRDDHDSGFDEEEFMEVPTTVPDDVKEGHFTVLAVKGAEKERFVVKLKYLTSPTFLRLLEQAEEEYGFEQTGALVIPCRPQELHKILEGNEGDESQFSRAKYTPSCNLIVA